MKTPRQAVRELLERLPDDSTFEDIQYHIFVLSRIERGLKDAREGLVLSHNEVVQRLSKSLLLS
jgi:predicted transcriptional regulator